MASRKRARVFDADIAPVSALGETNGSKSSPGAHARNKNGRLIIAKYKEDCNKLSLTKPAESKKPAKMMHARAEPLDGRYYHIWEFYAIVQDLYNAAKLNKKPLTVESWLQLIQTESVGHNLRFSFDTEESSRALADTFRLDWEAFRSAAKQYDTFEKDMIAISGENEPKEPSESESKQDAIVAEIVSSPICQYKPKTGDVEPSVERELVLQASLVIILKRMCEIPIIDITSDMKALVETI